jgi:diguanylate cyclase (GGDEF)-like protein/PAS domain S-box-containing protein
VKSRTNARLWSAFVATLSLWLIASWFATGFVEDSRTNALIEERSSAVDQLATSLAADIARDLDRLHSIPTLIANDPHVLGAMAKWGDVPLTPSPNKTQQKKIWSDDARLKTVNHRLGLASGALSVDVSFIMNEAGDCIASSNADKPDSFVGVNYADREYFRGAMEGKQGHQFAVGKTSNIPGLFFSAPITLDGHIAGVVAVKINLPAQSHWVNPADAFISDNYGVIVLAQDKKLEMRALPGAAIATLPDTRRMSRYKRNQFPEITVKPWEQQPRLALQTLNDSANPLLLVHKKIAHEDLTLHVAEPLPKIIEFAHERIRLFLLFGLLGALILLLIAGRIVFLRSRNRAQKQLQESEKRYHLLFDTNPMPMWVFAEDSLKFLEVNDRAVEHYGYTREEFARMTLHDIRPTADIPALNTILTNSPGGMVAMEVRHLKKNGQLIDVELSTMPMQYGGIAARIVLIQDITERKQAEAGLHQQLEFSRALNNIARIVVEQDNPAQLLEDTVHVISETLSTDRALIYDVSFSKRQAIGMTEWLNPRHPEIQPTKATFPLDIFIAGATEIRRTHHWLTSQHDQVNPYLVQDGSGDILHKQMMIRSLLWYPFAFREDGYYLLTLNHIYTQKEWIEAEIGFLDSVSQLVSVALEKIRLLAERNLTERDLHIAATAFESHEGMLITDAECNILRVNSAFSKITGYSPEEVIGKNPRMFSSGRQDQAFFKTMWDCINTDGTWEGEIWNRRKNGEVFPEHITIAAVKDDKGNVTNYVGALSDITLRKSAEAEIKSLAFYDPLTRLPNRRLLLDRLEQALASSARSGQEGALLFIDLDNFKTLNDTLGHDIGDLLLQQVAERLSACVREGDTVARLGGDEFVVMLEDLSKNALEAAAQTEAIGEKILAALNRPYQLAKHTYRNTPSIGATLFLDHMQAPDDIFKHADIAMYQAKKSGRNTLRFFDPQMQDSINARASLESELRLGLEKHQFELYYQIQVDETQRPLGAETLIRWVHPERGLISPLHFIPLAEETGLILPLGRWVLETACAQLRKWQQDPLMRHLVLAVNVSAKQFRQAGFVDEVSGISQRHGIDPSRLKLELTESMLLDNIQDTIANMNALKKIGVQFSLDDFGTGYSSLQYLKRLPLDQLKIDQSFVRDIANDHSDKAIVRTIIAMAHSLNLDVIAEGVETEAQRQPLQNKGCLHYQGYLFGKPVPIEQFESLLKQHA